MIHNLKDHYDNVYYVAVTIEMLNRKGLLTISENKKAEQAIRTLRKTLNQLYEKHGEEIVA